MKRIMGVIVMMGKQRDVIRRLSAAQNIISNSFYNENKLISSMSNDHCNYCSMGVWVCCHFLRLACLANAIAWAVRQAGRQAGRQIIKKKKKEDKMKRQTIVEC
jgi:hypothetical protein